MFFNRKHFEITFHLTQQENFYWVYLSFSDSVVEKKLNETSIKSAQVTDGVSNKVENSLVSKIFRKKVARKNRSFIIDEAHIVRILEKRPVNMIIMLPAVTEDGQLKKKKKSFQSLGTCCCSVCLVKAAKRCAFASQLAA